MKLFVICAVCVIIVSSCAKKPFSDIEGLRARIQSCAESRDIDDFMACIYMKGCPDEFVPAQKKFYSIVITREWPSIDAKIYKFGDYAPHADLPGSFGGQELEWIFQPTHWIIVECHRETESGYAKMRLELPVGQRDGSWWIVGVRYKK